MAYRLLLHLVLHLLFCTGGKCVVVKTHVGDDAVLPCEVDPTQDPFIDIAEMAIEWSRRDLPPGQYVHFQRDGEEVIRDKNPSYKGRTSLFMDEVKKGNMSLKLSRVKLSDEGNYTCNIPEILQELIVQLIVAEDVMFIPPQGVLRLLPDTSSVTEPITDILWKHGPNKAAEWDLLFGPDVDYYGMFKKRTELDKITGQLVINNMTINDTGEYSVHINGRLLDKTTVKLIKKVPRPLVATREPCDSDSTSCEVHCYGDVTESGPVTYLWKKDEGEWKVSDSGPNSNRLIVTRDEDGKVKTLTCAVKNVFSMERSHPQPNLLYEDGGLPWWVGLIIFLGVIVVIMVSLRVLRYRKRPGPSPGPSPGPRWSKQIL